MLFDLTVEIKKETKIKEKKVYELEQINHIGTHFDTMNKKFPLEYATRDGVIFNIKKNNDQDIGINHIDLSIIKKDMFVIFYSDYIKQYEYGSVEYYKEHPQLSHELINKLIELKVSIIGIDFPGIRRGNEHTPADQLCADNNLFIVENLCNLDKIWNFSNKSNLKINCYPINFSYLSGIPCRVIAEL